MARNAMLLGLLLCLAGCFAPGPEDVVRDWRPMGAAGPTLGEALSQSPGRKSTVWETYAGDDGQPLVRLTVEYLAAGADARCPKPAPGTRRAARVFLILEFAVAKNATPTFATAKAQVYTAKGYFEEYPLGLAVMADLMARAFPLPCADLDLPDYL